MEATEIRGILSSPESYFGKEIKVNGWVRTVRDVKACAFIELNDGSTVKNLQVVVDSALPIYKLAAGLNVGYSLIITGTVEQSPNPKQPVELKAAEIHVEGQCPPEYPLQKKRHTLEYLRTIQHLRPRTNTFNAVFRIRSEAAFAIHNFFHSRNFVYVHTPIITTSDAEGAGAMFQVTTMDMEKLPLNKRGGPDYTKDFFGTKSSLTVSGQLEGEAYATAFSKIYTFGPTFRAERSNTTRHAAEFWMIEPEIAFCDLNGLISLAEDMIVYVVKHVMQSCKDELEFLGRFVDTGLMQKLENVVSSGGFARVTYTEAIEQLSKFNEKFEFPVYWGCDLQTEHERYLTETIYKKPVFVTDYPKEIKAFYMRLNEDGKTVAAVDLLVAGIGELIGGSQREERLDDLKKRIWELGLDEEAYWWYLELRKYGSVTHSGYGIGFERLIMFLTGIGNIRDVLPYPRTVGNASF